MRLRRIGLDFDGTLNNTELRHQAALSQAAASLGVKLPFDFEKLYYQEKRKGRSGKQVLLQHDIPQAEKIAKLWIETAENESLLSLDSLYPNVIKTLEKMVGSGLVFYIATCRQDESGVRRQINQFGLQPLIEQVQIATLDLNGKLLKSKYELTKSIGLDAIIGDSEMDETWAKELGIPFLALSWGIRCQDYWQARQVAACDTIECALEKLLLQIK